MKKLFRCEKCNKEFATEVDCCKHERTCQPKSLEDRVEELERRVTNLQAALMRLQLQLWRMPAPTPTAPAPHNPYDGPWGPATCVAGEGPWGPYNKKSHSNVCDEAADRFEGCRTCVHLADECGTVSMIKTAGGEWRCSRYCRKPCK